MLEKKAMLFRYLGKTAPKKKTFIIFIIYIDITKTTIFVNNGFIQLTEFSGIEQSSLMFFAVQEVTTLDNYSKLKTT